MRNATLTLALLAPVLAAGCVAPCASPASLSDRSYRVFTNSVTMQNDNVAFNAPPTFYSYTTPANGAARWTFDWGNTPDGPVDVIIDGQRFEGTGEWNERECGHATIDFEGNYFDEASGVEHRFNAAAAITIWQDELGGLLIWNETWTAPDGGTGSFRTNANMHGVLAGG